MTSDNKALVIILEEWQKQKHEEMCRLHQDIERMKSIISSIYKLSKKSCMQSYIEKSDALDQIREHAANFLTSEEKLGLCTSVEIEDAKFFQHVLGYLMQRNTNQFYAEIIDLLEKTEPGSSGSAMRSLRAQTPDSV